MIKNKLKPNQDIPNELRLGITQKLSDIRGYIAICLFGTSQDVDNDYKFYFNQVYVNEFNALLHNLADDIISLMYAKQDLTEDKFMFLVILHGSKLFQIRGNISMQSSYMPICRTEFAAFVTYYNKEKEKVGVTYVN